MATDNPDIGAALDALTSSVTDMQTRVTGDLTNLRDEVAQLQQSGQPVDAQMIVERLTTITQTVEQIDVTAVVQTGGDGGGAPAPGDPGAPGDATTGDQGGVPTQEPGTGA